MKKEKKYILIIGLLLLSNVALVLLPEGESRQSKKVLGGLKIEEVQSITYETEKHKVVLTKEAEGWGLNDSLRADGGMVETLQSILARVEKIKPIKSKEDTVLGHVILDFAGEKIEMNFSSNPARTLSYFSMDGEVSEVGIPGYSENIIDIFTLHPDQWQDRRIFDGNWRTIQHLRIEYPDSQHLDLTFQDTFFLVNGDPAQDSTAIINYLRQFEYFQANEMVSAGRLAPLDSLKKTPPMAEMQIDDINIATPIQLVIYPKLAGQAFHLVCKGSQMMVFDARRIEGILQSASDLQAQ